jgi:nitrite reductase (NADH) large subunit
MHKQSYVIIGSSAAGIAAANKLRTIDATSQITCITTETRMPYNRCLIADVLGGKKTADGITTRTAAFFTEQHIDLQLGTTVTEIDCSNQRVLTACGKALAYDKLLIATGRSGWIIPITGNTLAGVIPLYGLDDVTAILAYCKNVTVKNVVIIGAGLTGLECADALLNHGFNLTLIEREQRVLHYQLNDAGSSHFINLMTNAGVNIITGATLAAIEGANHVQAVTLTNGTTLLADMVIFATGGRTNSNLAQQAGIALHNNAIDVNEHQSTSRQSVFAAGDVATVIDQTTGTKMQSCLWSDAAKQGMIAASNMAGIQISYDGSSMVTSSTIFNTTFVTAGAIAHPPKHLKLLTKKTDAFYHAFLVDNANILKGFSLVGNIDNIGALRKKLIEKTPLF